MRFSGKYRPDLPGFQIAPMVDVIFSLLCFFLVGQIYSKWETEIDITLPTAQTGAFAQRLPGEIIVNVLDDGSAVVNQQHFDDAGLAALLTRVVKLFPGQPVLIRADVTTPYGHVIKILDLCRKAEVWNISFATSMPPKPSST
jgi:biopolymer transport protein ExbD